MRRLPSFECLFCVYFSFVFSWHFRPKKQPKMPQSKHFKHPNKLPALVKIRSMIWRTSASRPSAIWRRLQKKRQQKKVLWKATVNHRHHRRILNHQAILLSPILVPPEKISSRRSAVKSMDSRRRRRQCSRICLGKVSRKCGFLKKCSF